MSSVQHSHDCSIDLENVSAYRTLRRGDHLAVEGEQEGLQYYHHGIFLGHDKGIAEFGGATKRNAKVRIVDILQFTNNGQRRLVRINNQNCLPPEEAAQNAEKLIENPHRWGPYDLLANNCEHFAMKCKTGVAVSFQVIQRLRECLKNPLQLIKYAGASSGGVGSGFGSLESR